jgi:hypothetical protein
LYRPRENPLVSGSKRQLRIRIVRISGVYYLEPQEFSGSFEIALNADKSILSVAETDGNKRIILVRWAINASYMCGINQNDLSTGTSRNKFH